MIQAGENQIRNNTIDILKGISIIVVVAYHLKIITNGYLGVDVFFVIAGFLAAATIQRRRESKKYRSSLFVYDRLLRLLPLALLGGIVCLIIGCTGMLPNDYENLCASVFFSNILSENILEVITTKNYWDVVNDYKPLMHTWYVGVLFEFYVFFPICVFLSNSLSHIVKRKSETCLIGVVSFLTGVSFLIYLVPTFSEAARFYYLPFRFWECSVGSLIFYYTRNTVGNNITGIVKCVFTYSCLAGLFVLFLVNFNPLPRQAKLVLTVILTAMIIVSTYRQEIHPQLPILEGIGRRSYSIFIWHQILLAFYRYFFSAENSVIFFIMYIAFVLLISELSYRLVEDWIFRIKPGLVLSVLAFLFSVSTVFSVYIYVHAGVIRDVPELGVKKNTAHRGLHGEYTDRIYGYDKDFADDGRIKVFLTGYSYARDFGNVLLESVMSSKVDLSFAQYYSSEYRDRVEEADYVFVYGLKEQYPTELFEIGNGEYWGIGSKNFGESNGIIYRHRFAADYFDQSVYMNDEWVDEVNKERAEWGDHYIDLVSYVQKPDGSMPVFTDDHMFISQDCRHLTQAGAQYYARLIDWSTIFIGGEER